MTLVQKMRFLYSRSLWNNHSDPFFSLASKLLLNLKSWQMQVVGKTWSCCNIKSHGFKFSIILFNRHQRQLFHQSTFTIIIPVTVCKCIQPAQPTIITCSDTRKRPNLQSLPISIRFLWHQKQLLLKHSDSVTVNNKMLLTKVCSSQHATWMFHFIKFCIDLIKSAMYKRKKLML